MRKFQRLDEFRWKLTMLPCIERHEYYTSSIKSEWDQTLIPTMGWKTGRGSISVHYISLYSAALDVDGVITCYAMSVGHACMQNMVIPSFLNRISLMIAYIKFYQPNKVFLVGSMTKLIKLFWSNSQSVVFFFFFFFFFVVVVVEGKRVSS